VQAANQTHVASVESWPAGYLYVAIARLNALTLPCGSSLGGPRSVGGPRRAGGRWTPEAPFEMEETHRKEWRNSFKRKVLDGVVWNGGMSLLIP
jgi:hypothetical protein